MGPWSVSLATVLATGPGAVEALELGHRAVAAGKLPEARSHFRAATELSPDLGLAYLELGVVEQQLDPESEPTRESLRHAARLLTDNPRAQYHWGLAAERIPDPAAAIAAFARCLELRPGFRDAEFRLALLLETVGRLDDARARLESLAAADPSHSGALAALARLCEAQSRWPQAEKALLALTRLLPHVPYHQVQLAQFYERTGQRQKAQRALARADALGGTDKKSMRPLKPSSR